MAMPPPNRIFVNIDKLRSYCLPTTHDDGSHKAIVFRAALGVSLTDAVWLRDEIVATATRSLDNLVYKATGKYGVKYELDMHISHHARTALVRTGWIVLNGEDVLRLTTCYVISRS